MSKKKFDKLTGKPYDQLFDGVGYEKDFDDRNNNGVKDTKETISGVKPKPNSEDGSFGPDNYFRLIWMYFLHDAEEKLNPVQKLKVEKVLSWGAIGLFALMIIVVTLCSAFGLNK